MVNATDEAAVPNGDPTALNAAAGDREWESDGPLAIEVGPWGETSPTVCTMWNRYDEDGASRIYRLLEEDDRELLETIHDEAASR